jgi:hypothetical protein
MGGLSYDGERGFSILDRIADRYGIHKGPEARRALRELAAELLPEHPKDTDYEGVVREFQSWNRITRTSLEGQQP